MLNKPSLSSLFFNPLGRPLDRFIYWMPNESRSVATRFSPVSLPVWRVPRPHHHSPHFFGFLNGREKKKFKIPWIFMRKEQNYRGRDEIWMQSVCKHTQKHVCTFFLRHSSVALQCALRKLFFSRIFRWPCSWDRIFILSIQEWFDFSNLAQLILASFLSPAVEVIF
jgi:hypothetical protein